MKNKLKKIKSILSRDELGILPASLTYYFVLAIIPILTLMVLIASSFHISIDKVIALINDMLPYKISNFVVDIIAGKGFDGNVGFFNIVAFFVATNGTYAIVKTANNLYKVKDTDVIKARIKSVIILFNILLLLIFLVLVPIFGENILLLCQKSETFSLITDKVIFVVNLLKWPISFFIIFFNIKLIYTIAPSKNIKSKDTTTGVAFKTVVWSLLIIVFRFYLQYFAKYDILYGNLSSIIIMMVWVYTLSYIFTLGMAINVSKKEDI